MEEVSDTSDAYPIDFDELEKGYVIDKERVRDIYKPLTEQDHSFAVLDLIAHIERERPDLYPVGRKGAVVVLTDREAQEHSVKRHEKIVGDMRRNARRRTRIDASQFSDAERRVVEHWDVQTAAQSMEAASKLRLARRDATLMLAVATQRKS